MLETDLAKFIFLEKSQDNDNLKLSKCNNLPKKEFENYKGRVVDNYNAENANQSKLKLLMSDLLKNHEGTLPDEKILQSRNEQNIFQANTIDKVKFDNNKNQNKQNFHESGDYSYPEEQNPEIIPKPQEALDNTPIFQDSDIELDLDTNIQSSSNCNSEDNLYHKKVVCNGDHSICFYRIVITEKSLNKIRSLYDEICDYSRSFIIKDKNQLKNSNSNKTDANNKKEINLFIEEVIANLNNADKNEFGNQKQNKSISDRNTSTFKAISSLLQFCFKKLIDIISLQKPALAKIVSSLVESTFGIIKGLISQCSESVLLKEFEQLGEQIKEVMETAENMEKSMDKLQIENNNLKEELKKVKENSRKVKEIMFSSSIELYKKSIYGSSQAKYKNEKLINKNQSCQSLYAYSSKSFVNTPREMERIYYSMKGRKLSSSLSDSIHNIGIFESDKQEVTIKKPSLLYSNNLRKNQAYEIIHKKQSASEFLCNNLESFSNRNNFQDEIELIRNKRYTKGIYDAKIIRKVEAKTEVKDNIYKNKKVKEDSEDLNIIKKIFIKNKDYSHEKDIDVKKSQILPIEETKEIILKLFCLKKIYDEKCYEEKRPRNSMKQYLHIFFDFNSRKFLCTANENIEDLIIKWEHIFIKSFEFYFKMFKENNIIQDEYFHSKVEILTFYRIYHNECDEEYRDVLVQLKNALKDSLENLLIKNRKNIIINYSSENEAKIQEIKMDLIKNNNILEDQWKTILKEVYNQTNFKIIENKIKNTMKEFSKHLIRNSNLNLKTMNRSKLNPSNSLPQINHHNSDKTITAFNLNPNTQLKSIVQENESYFTNEKNLNEDEDREILHKSTRFGFEFDNHYDFSESELGEKKSNFNVVEHELEEVVTFNDKSLPYYLFESIVLEFQLESHSKYIRKYVKLFRMYDLNNQGFISRDNFKNMLKCMKIEGLNDKTIENITFKAYSLSLNQITFSESVLLLLMEQISIMNSSLNPNLNLNLNLNNKKNSKKNEAQNIVLETNEKIKTSKVTQNETKNCSIMDLFLNS